MLNYTGPGAELDYWLGRHGGKWRLYREEKELANWQTESEARERSEGIIKSAMKGDRNV
jgi:hypothetical protein